MKSKLIACAVVVVALLSMQLVAISGASAAVPSTNLVVRGEWNFGNNLLGYSVCNEGSDSSIKSFTLDIDLTNFEIDETYIPPFDAFPAGGKGTLSSDGLTWTGVLLPDPDGNGEAQGECIHFGAPGHATGAAGAQVTATVSIASAVLSDDSLNNDTDPANNTLVYTPFTIAAGPDISAEAHLATTGEITADMDVDYQIDVRNSTGIYHHNDFLIFAFTLPADAEFVSVTDDDPDDGLVASNDACSGAITMGVDIQFPGLEPFAGRHVVVCNLGVVDGELPADSSIVYPFTVTITAGESLASGDAEVVGILEGNDADTGTLLGIISRGDNILDAINDHINNNMFYLAYDPTDLTVTVNRCPGQAATTTNGNGCFRIIFNKKIVADSFTVDDLNLGGVGSVTGFDKIDDTTWEVHVTGITPGQTLTLKLGASSVQDYSAVQNGVQVLGENTIRWAVDDPADDTDSDGTAAGTTTASGSLPLTGVGTTAPLTAILLLMTGFAISRAARRKATL